MPNTLVIGITGSYGKTTVKEYLYQILSTKFSVVKTPKNINSDIGITKFILQTDFSKTQIFIVEIGAYNRGDIALICDIIHPKIGILTAINEQHLSLFGTIQNIQQTKYELLRSLPKDGLAVTNADNKYCTEFLHELDAAIMTFGLDEENKPSCLIKDVQVTKTGEISIQGSCVFNENVYEQQLVTHITGEHNVLNIAACIPVATYLNMKCDEIVHAIKHIQDPETSISIYPYGTSIIIDDSHNSNPQGFKAVLELLNKYPSDKKRVVITRGMLELGGRSNEIHEQIGGEIAFIADELVIITPDFIEPLKRGTIGKKYGLNVKIILDDITLLRYITALKDDNAVILIENRVPGLIKKELLKFRT